MACLDRSRRYIQAMTLSLFKDMELPPHVVERYNNPNPMVKKSGFGPKGEKCKSCHFILRVKPNTKVYYKCQYRGISSGAGTDHRLKWDACSQYHKEGDCELRHEIRKSTRR